MTSKQAALAAGLAAGFGGFVLFGLSLGASVLLGAAGALAAKVGIDKAA
jgi:hypothetical protein